MKCSEAGLDLIKRSEGLRLKAYRDSVGVLTVGYGSTGSHVFEGMEISDFEADNYLRKDIETAEKCIANSVTVVLTADQHAALCSFVFNLGCGAFRKSSLLTKLNAGDDDKAAEVFLRYVYAGGKILPGLVTRRQAEHDLFMQA